MENYKVEKATPTSVDFKFLYSNETGVWINNKLPIEDSDYALNIIELNIKQIIKKFRHLISQKQLKQIKDYAK